MAKFIVFFESVFSFLIFIRLADELCTKNILDQRTLTKIVAAFLLWILVEAFFLNKFYFLFSILLWVPVILFHFSPIVIGQQRRRQFQKEFPVFLNQIILKVRMGVSLRFAMQAASQNLTDFSRTKVEKIIQSLFFQDNQQKNSNRNTKKPNLDVEILAVGYFSNELDEIVHCLQDSDRDSHKTLPRLLMLREKLKTAAVFRAKRKRILGPIYAQTVVMSVLYIALMGFIIYQFGWLQNAKIIVITSAIFAAGGVCTIQVGRSFKWRV